MHQQMQEAEFRHIINGYLLLLLRDYKVFFSGNWKGNAEGPRESEIQYRSWTATKGGILFAVWGQYEWDDELQGCSCPLGYVKVQ